MIHVSASESGSHADRVEGESRSVGVAPEVNASGIIQHQRQIRNAVSIKNLYAALYSHSHTAKIWRVAKAFLAQDVSCMSRLWTRTNWNECDLKNYPEHLPASSITYRTKPSSFWTCAFLPGCLFALAERLVKFPKALPIPLAIRPTFHAQLLDLCRSWCKPLHHNALRTDTHDLGFMVHPLRMDWELTGNANSLESLIKAAYNLSSRFSEKTGAIRSWNLAESKTYSISDTRDNFLVIIDSMANMELLFYVGNYTGDQELIRKATMHVKTVTRTLLRPDFSTHHVVNMNPENGQIKHHFTHQGYSDSSCWSRGQAWALLGFAQAYNWTGDPSFLVVAMSVANYFVQQLARSQLSHAYVPPWDFTAPLTPDSDVVRDTSAGMIAANGLLLLHQTLQGQSPFLEAVQRIIEDTLEYSLSSESTTELGFDDFENGVEDQSQSAILMHSTANKNENALVQYYDHGYVVADFYFLELGNKLLRMAYFG